MKNKPEVYPHSNFKRKSKTCLSEITLFDDITYYLSMVRDSGSKFCGEI